MSFDELGHIEAAALFEGFEDANLVGEAFLSVRAFEVFMHVSVEIDFYQGSDTVFEVAHVLF